MTHLSVVSHDFPKYSKKTANLPLTTPLLLDSIHTQTSNNLLVPCPKGEEECLVLASSNWSSWPFFSSRSHSFRALRNCRRPRSRGLSATPAAASFRMGRSPCKTWPHRWHTI